MNKKVSVDLGVDTPYIEKNNKIGEFKREMSYKFAFNLIKRHLYKNEIDPNNIDVLEVGIGSGYFPKFLFNKFSNAKYVGLEYDPRLIEFSREKAPKGTFIQGNAESFQLDQQFDIVVSFQVVEHLYDPSAMLRNVYDHLKQGGLFLLTTPNLDGVGASIMGENWHGYRYDHVSLKGHDEWVNLIEGQGFERSFSGSTFFTGLPWFNKMPLALINWFMLMAFGALKWSKGESFVGAFIKTEIESESK